MFEYQIIKNITFILNGSRIEEHMYRLITFKKQY